MQQTPAEQPSEHQGRSAPKGDGGRGGDDRASKASASKASASNDAASDASASKPSGELPGPLSANWTRSTVQNSRQSAAGMQFGLTIVVFAAGGYFLDRWLDSSPWCLLAAVALGFAGGLYSLLRQMPAVKSNGKPK